MKAVFISFFWVLAISVAVADLPITVDGVIIKNDENRLDISTSIDIRNNRDVTSGYQFIKDGDGEYVMVATDIGAAYDNAVYTTMNIGLRHGISPKTEIFGSLTGMSVNQESLDSTGDYQTSNSAGLRQLSIGINHSLNEPDTDMPLIASASARLAENASLEDDDWSHLKTVDVGLSTYKMLDPVLLSAKVGYQHAAERNIGEEKQNPGDLLYLSPSLNFLANDQVTLFTSADITHKQRDQIEGEKTGASDTQANLSGGINYRMDKKHQLSLDVSQNITGEDNAAVTLGFSRKF